MNLLGLRDLRFCNFERKNQISPQNTGRTAVHSKIGQILTRMKDSIPFENNGSSSQFESHSDIKEVKRVKNDPTCVSKLF